MLRVMLNAPFMPEQAISVVGYGIHSRPCGKLDGVKTKVVHPTWIV